MKISKFLAIIAIALGGSSGVFGGDFNLVTNSTVTVPNSVDAGATSGIFDQSGFRSGGTGVIQPFLRIQANGSETGYNTSGSPVPFDDKAGPFTRDLLLSDLALVTLSGQAGTFYQFRLDVNQTSNSANPDMFRFDLYMTNTGGQTGSTVNGTLIYSLGAHDILVPATGSGSGQGNVDIFIPSNLFVGGTNVVLFAGLGGELGPTNDGFEEFAALQGQIVNTPDSGATLMLLGATLAGLEILRRFLAKRSVAARCKI